MEIQTRKFHAFIQDKLFNCNTMIGKVIDFVFLFFNFIFCLLFVMETYPISVTGQSVIFAIEITLSVFFILEYVTRLYGAENKLQYVFSIYAIIDVISIMPIIILIIFSFFGINFDLTFIKIIRILKIFRIFRLFRITSTSDFFFGQITLFLLKLFRLILTIVIIFFLSSGFFYYLEKDVNSGIKNFSDAFYFTVVALTTVGFGDITPVTMAGRWVTLFMILSGIIFIPWQASQIIKEWVLISSKIEVICKKCGLKYHDKDASHCKHCGNIIYQETDGLVR